MGAGLLAMQAARCFSQTASMPSRASPLPQMGACSGLARGLDDHLDQRYQPGGQSDPAGRTLGILAFGASARQEPEQGNNPHAPQRRVLDPQGFLPVAGHPAHFLQGLQQLLRFMTNLLAVHFHAQANQGFAQLLA